jgi:Na+/H+ antiporter NhaD/arsenite permease-like protein
LHWGSGLVSGVVDNVPMALAMAYLMKTLAALPGAPALSIMLWSLALGLNVGGNLTPVGASANVVAYSYMERAQHHIGWGRWIKCAAVPTLSAMLLCSALLLAKYASGWY